MSGEHGQIGESGMGVRRLGIIMNGVTGRMGTNQHLMRSIVAIRAQGGVALGNGDHVVPDPILVGRNKEKLARLAKANGIARITTDLDAALADANDTVFFDAGTTQMRPALLAKAIAAGKHVYCEKPVATTVDAALGIVRKAKAAGICHGVVQDKLFLPGLRKLKLLTDSGFFGRIFAVRGEFGYWVFEGDLQPAQRPSWNYRAEEGGGIILDMLCHWRYVLDNIFGAVRSVSCVGATHIPERIDEGGARYKVTADDAAYTTFQLEGGIIAQFNSSWATRVRRDDLLTLHVDGTHGSAVAGLQEVVTQQRMATPKPVWNPDIKQPIDFRAGWQPVPDTQAFDNGFKLQWEAFIRHVAEGAPYTWDLVEGAKGVQLVDCALRSWRERRWIDVPDLNVS
jgi:predicted dehydrogenase